MNSSLKLKVCGLTKIDQIAELIALNIDFLGFIFYQKSPRYALNSLTLEEIKSVEHKGKVGVFVNEKIDIVAEICAKSQLNFIQLHGDENINYINELKNILPQDIKIIKVFRIGNAVDDLQEEILKVSSADYFLFDTDSQSFGGTGQSFDWRILDQIIMSKPYFLSGGINEANFQNVKLLNQIPFALDINSKFERTPGNKNIQQIKEFTNLLLENLSEY